MSKMTFQQAFATEVFFFTRSNRSLAPAHVALVAMFAIGVGYPVLSIMGFGFVAAVLMAPLVGAALHALLLVVLALMRVYSRHD